MRAFIYAMFFLLAGAVIAFAVHYRSHIESYFIPVVARIRGQSSLVCAAPEATIIEIEKLQEENKMLKRQLGAIPDKAEFVKAEVIWDSGDSITLSGWFEGVQKGQAVISGETLLGIVSRNTQRVAEVKRPSHSSFSMNAKTQSVQGKVKGIFGEQVRFVYPTGKDVRVGDVVWAVDSQRGWQFIVGTVERVESDRRKAMQEAWVSPSTTTPHTVFIVR